MKKKTLIILSVILLLIIGYYADKNKDDEAENHNTNEVVNTTEIVTKTEEQSVVDNDVTAEDNDNKQQTTTDTTEAITTKEDTTESTQTEIIDSEEEPQELIFSDIPPYSGNPYVEINNNIPFFTEKEKTIENSFEHYEDFDELGRCGVAYACLSKELLPTEERGEIGDVRPSGWHTVKYNDLIDGNYLYNRCHLIAYSLAGENANPKNLITGTRYLNTVGMLTFENRVREYVENTDNHVLYRVTPIFEDNNLVASGVEMEAWSVEDGGNSICFNVYCYNVQPYIDIDYLTGDSSVSSDAPSTIVFDDVTTEEYVEIDRDITEEDPGEGDEDITEEDLTSSTTEYTTEASTEPQADYIVNKNSKKIHLPTCSSVDDMAEHNKWYYVGSLEELKEMGYKPCQRCLKGY